MADLTIQGEVVVTSEKAESAFDRVAGKADRMASEIAGAAGKAGQAVDGIGAGAEKGAERFTRAEARMRDSIRRSTQELQLLGKTASEKLEFNIGTKGLDATKFAPYLEQLKQAERAHQIATGSLDKMGVSAGQTRAALAQLPMQFSDIVVSLQGGQAPLTVFLQQGAQIKDAFGGAGNAAKALGGYVLGMVNPLTLAAGAVATLGLAYYQGSKEADAFRRSLVMTGNAAGTTAGEMQAMAAKISMSGGTQGNAASVLAQLAGTGEVSRANMVKFGEVVVAAERNIGTAVEDTVKHFAELGKSPVEASLKLNEQYRYLTASVYEQIRALRDQGRQTEAANLAQNTYANAMASRAAELKVSLGYVERAWLGIKDAAKGGWDAMLNVGRQDTAADQLAKARADLEARQSRGPLNEGTRANWEKGNDSLRQQIAALTEVERLEKRNAEASARKVAANEAGRRFADMEYEARSKQQKLEAAITKIRTDGLAAKKSEAEIQRVIEFEKAKSEYKDSGAESAIKREQSAYANLIASIKTKIEQNDEELRFSGRLTEADKLRIKLMAELDAGSKTLTAAHKAEAVAQLAKLGAQEREMVIRKQTVALYVEQAAMADEVAQAYAAESKAREQGMLAVYDYGRGIKESNDALAYELSLVGQSERARERAMAQYRIELDLKRQIEAINKNTGFSAADRERETGKAQGSARNALAGVDARLALDGLKELDAYLDPARAKDFGAALSDAFGEAGNSLAQLTNSFQDYVQQQAELGKMQERLAQSKGSISQAEYYKREQALASKSAQAQVNSYASIAGAAKGFFKDHSKGYQAMEAAEKGFRLMEMALAVESMTKQLFGINAVTAATVAGEQIKTQATVSGVGVEVAANQIKGQSDAVVAVTNQAKGGDPYTAWPRMAAMAAAMAALGFAVAGGSGSSSSAVREERQKSQGTGTVFGDSGAKSGSLGNAFDMLEDSAKMELRYQSGMLASLRNIENAMSGVANAVLRTVGITSGNGVGVYEGVLSTNKGDPIMNALGLGGLDRLGTNLPLIGGVIGKLQSLWGKTKQEITDSGLVINGMVADLAAGLGFGQYADVTTTKSSFFGLSKSKKSKTIFGDLDGDTSEALGRVFAGLSSTLQMASGAFGKDADAVSQQIAKTIINIPRTSLRDLKGDELTDAISAVISAAADKMGKRVIPGLADFQRVGEGYFETIVRVSAGIESADYALEKFGISAIAYSKIASKQGDVAAEIFRDSVTKFEGAGSGMAQIIAGITGSVDDLADSYKGLLGVRNSLKSVGARGFDPSFDLLRGAGGLEALQDGLDNYLEGYFSETEQFTAASARLSEQFAQMGIRQPPTIEAFRALVSGLDLTNAASAQLFGKLMTVADAFYDVANAVEESKRALKEAFDDVAGDWLDGEALRSYRAGRISESLMDVGLSISPEQILGASVDQFKAMYYAIDQTTMAGREQATALLGVWDVYKEMNAAAEQAKAAWQGVADSIVDEIKRIRGEIVGKGAHGLTQAQAQFAIATAQARSGDQTAALSLPELSRTVLDLAKQNAKSALELKTYQAQIAASLLETTKGFGTSFGIKVPSLAVGTAYVPGDTLAQLHKGEAVIPAAFNPFTAGASKSEEETRALLAQLVDENRTHASAIARLNSRVAKVLERWDSDGMPANRLEGVA